MDIAARRTLLAALPHLPAILPATVLLITAADRLPDPIAGRFALSGAADGVADRWTVIGIHAAHGLGATLLFAVLARVVARRPSTLSVTSGDAGRQLVGASWAAAGVVGVIAFCATAANLDLADAADATLPGWSTPLALAAGAVAAAAGVGLTSRTPATADVPDTAPAVRLADGEQVSWSRTVNSPALIVVGGVVAIGGAATSATAGAAAAAISLGVGALVALFGRARATVDRRGLRVSMGPLPWLRIRIPAEDIVTAVATDVSALQFGGWGYRILRGGRGVIVRSGPALVVTRRSGTRFTVTIDDPATAAGLLNGFSEQRAAARKG